MSRLNSLQASNPSQAAAVSAADAAEFHDALQDLLRVAEVRDRERICCHGITVTECHSLEILSRGGPLMLNQLAGELRLDKSTASRVVASLEEKGLLRRGEDPEDRRALRLRLTARGESLRQRIRGEIEVRHAALLAELDPAARRAVTALLRRVAAELVCGSAGAGASPAPHKEAVKEAYARAALLARSGGLASCCGGEANAASCCDPISSDLYARSETAGLPREALRASLGCGNPVGLAEMAPGETVLDLGSGGGIDVLLSARRVGPNGKVYGLDMTEEMLELARENQRRAGVENVEFLHGEIERIPLPDDSVDVIVSNCVINLSSDKRRVLSEAFRVLKPGGRFAVSDIVVRGELPAEVRRSLEMCVGCIAGALEESELERLLDEIGFRQAEIEPTRIYRLEDARELLSRTGLDVDRIASQIEGIEGIEGCVMSAFVRARKPAS